MGSLITKREAAGEENGRGRQTRSTKLTGLIDAPKMSNMPLI